LAALLKMPMDSLVPVTSGVQDQPAEAVRRVLAELVRLLRYEIRAVSRLDPAIREIIKVRQLAQSALAEHKRAKAFVQNEPNFLKANQ
jgi:hypothetical protein